MSLFWSNLLRSVEKLEAHMRAVRLTLVGEYRDGIDPLGSEGIEDGVSEENVSEEE